MSGEKLRVKFVIGDATSIYRFDLSNSSNAINYAMNLCKEYSARVNTLDDEDYFKNNNSLAPNENFPKKPRTNDKDYF
jgi:hypothetical protein